MKSSSLMNRSTLHHHLERELKERLGGRCVGFRLPPEKELANELKVSIPTLRKTLGVLEEEQLIEQGEGRGWKVTPNAKDPRIAILNDLDLTVPRTPSMYLAQIQTAKRLLEAEGRPVAIYLGDEVSGSEPPAQLSCRQFLRDLEEGRFSGVLATWAYPQKEWTDRLKAKGIPLVGFGQLHETMVSYDIDAVITSAIELLQSRGRRRIAFLGGVSQWNLGGYDQRRMDRIRALLQKAGLEVEEKWIRQDWHPSLPAAAWSSFREIWTGTNQRPDAVIVAAPRLWAGTKEALDSLQLTFPDQLDVVVCRTATNPLRDTAGALEYVFDPEAMTHAAVGMLLGLMNGETLASPRRYIDGWSLQITTADAAPAEVPALFDPLLQPVFY